MLPFTDGEQKCVLGTSFDISNVRISRKKTHTRNFPTVAGDTANLFMVNSIDHKIPRPRWVTSDTTRKQPQKSKRGETGILQRAQKWDKDDLKP